MTSFRTTALRLEIFFESIAFRFSTKINRGLHNLLV